MDLPEKLSRQLLTVFSTRWNDTNRNRMRMVQKSWVTPNLFIFCCENGKKVQWFIKSFAKMQRCILFWTFSGGEDWRSHLDECVSPTETLRPVQEYTCFGIFRNGSAGFLKAIQSSLKFECLFVSNLFQDDPKMIFNNVQHYWRLQPWALWRPIHGW